MAAWKGFPDSRDIIERNTLRDFIAALKDVSGPLIGPALFRLAVRKMAVSAPGRSISSSERLGIIINLCDQLGVPREEVAELIASIAAEMIRIEHEVAMKREQAEQEAAHDDKTSG